MRTDADRTQIVATETPLQFEHEHDVGELALAVAAPRRITPPLEVRGIKIDATDAVGEAADMRDAAIGRGADPVDQLSGQREKTEKIRGELRVETVIVTAHRCDRQDVVHGEEVGVREELGGGR